MASVIIVVAGFLGSGKTTFVQKLLQKNILISPILILINDFGEQIIDTPLLQRQGSVVQELPAGCICCSSTEEFRDFLHQAKSQDIGTLLIEATGLADIPALRWEMSVAGILPDTVFCVIDPKLYLSLHDVIPSVAEQPASADVICLSKTDIHSADTIAQCTQLLSRQFPLVPMLPLQNGTYPTAELLPYIVPESHVIAVESSVPELPFHRHFHHPFDIRLISWQGVLPLETLQTMLEQLPKQLVRLKARIPVVAEGGMVQNYLAQKTLSGINIMPLPNSVEAHHVQAYCMIIDGNVDILSESVNIMTSYLPSNITDIQITTAKAEKKTA